MSQTRTIIELLQDAQRRLATQGIGTPRLDAELLLGYCLGTDRAALYRDSQGSLTGETRERFWECVRRRERREPVAYIIGRKEFWSHSLHGPRGVLIPRPETEVLVQEALTILQGRMSSGGFQTVLDIGTGSGAIAVALGAECPHVRIIALDISPGALATARANSAACGLDRRVWCVQADGVSAIKCAGHIDLAVCNPPYIPSGDIETLAPEIRDYEPRVALDGGSDGLAFYRTHLPAVGALLKDNGWVVVEIGSGQGDAVAALLAQTHACHPGRIVRDYAGHERVVVAQKKALPT